MFYLLMTAILLLSPALLVGSLVFPFYWIRQYRLLRRTGSWTLQKEFHARWMKFGARSITVAYVLCLGGIFLPGLFPTIRQFLEGGWMLSICIPLVFGMVLLMAYSPDLAVKQWRLEQAPH